MIKRTFQALAIVLAVSLVAFAGFATGAANGSASGDSGGESGNTGTSFFERLHSIGRQLHQHGGVHGHHGGGEGFFRHVGELVKQLDLSPEQTERLEAIHRTLESRGVTPDGSMAELHDQLVEQFQQGYIEADAVERMIDQQLAEIRTIAYSVTDDLLALVNSLDAGQREIVLAHLQGDHRGHAGHDH